MSAWDEIPLSDVLTPVKRPVVIEDEQVYKQVTVMVKGRGAKLRGEQAGSAIGTKRQNAVRPGDVILSKIDARHGAVAVIPASLDGAVVTQDFPLFSVKQGDPAFVALLLASSAFVEIANLSSRGTTNRRRLNVSNLMEQTVAFPSIETQRVVAAACLDVKIACGGLVAAIDAWRMAAEALPSAYLEALVAGSDIPKVPLGELLTPVKRPVILDDDTTYRRVGLRSWGRGARVRDTVIGKEVGTKRQSVVRKGDFIYSTINAVTGNFAVIDDETDGCIAKSNYPTFTVLGTARPEYLALLCSTPGPVLVDIQATARGTAQPNVPTARFLAIRVPLPDLDTQASIAAAAQASIAAAAQASIAADAYCQTVKELQQTLIDELITGKVTPDEALAKLTELSATLSPTEVETA